MSKNFERYPDTVFKSPTDYRVVNDAAEADAAAAEGYKALPSTAQNDSDQSEEVARLRTNLDEADKLIAQLDEAGAKATSERDDARRALEEAQGEIESLKAQLAKPSKADDASAEREALKKDLTDLKVPFARNAPIETLRKLLDEATR